MKHIASKTTTNFYSKIIFFISISLFLFSCNHAEQNAKQKTGQTPILETIETQEDLIKVAEDIRNVLSNQLKGWNNGSVDTFMIGYWNSESLKFITKDGIKFGYNRVKDDYKNSYKTKEKMGNLTFENLAFTPLADNNTIVNVTGRWIIKQSNIEQSGLFSLILKKIDNNWKIIIDHTW